MTYGLHPAVNISTQLRFIDLIIITFKKNLPLHSALKFKSLKHRMFDTYCCSQNLYLKMNIVLEKARAGNTRTFLNMHVIYFSSTA